MVVRELVEKDIKNGFLDVLENLSSLEGLSMVKAEIIFKKISKNPNHKIFVAVDGSRVVGSITLLVEQKFIHDGGKAGHIEDVVVCEDFEGRGVGSRLVKKALEESRKSNCYKVVLHCNSELVSFYRRLGFRRTGNEMRVEIIKKNLDFFDYFDNL